jgi:HEAT repeat protein
MKRYFGRGLAVLVVLSGLVPALRAVDTGPVPYQNMREAVKVLGKTTDLAEAQRVYDCLPRVPVRDRGDLMALYHGARMKEADVDRLAKDADFNGYERQTELIAARMRTCTDSSLHADIAALLAKEYVASLRWRSNPAPSLAGRDSIKNMLQGQRFMALLDAAGKGKNEKARSTLMTMVEREQDGLYGQLAAKALGRIGNREDIDRLIAMIKADPSLRISLGDFGPALISRAVAVVVGDPAVSEDVRASIVGDISRIRSRESLPALLPLIQNENAALAYAATTAVVHSLDSDDAALIRQMLHDPSPVVRMDALAAVGGQAWSDDFVPLVVDMLKHDSSYKVRSIAAGCLGRHKVQSAVPALEAAAQRSDPELSDAAKDALKLILGK